MKRIEKIFSEILNAAFEVHTKLGPGLLEHVYQNCLVYEIKSRGYKVEVEKEVPVIYKGIRFEDGYRVDIFVEELIIIEVKAVKNLNESHLAQILTYMRLTDVQLGLLVNFNEVRLKNGIKRVVENYKL